MRPSFTPAAPPEQGEQLYNRVVALLLAQHPDLATGEFGAYMQINLCNDGPVTFTLSAR